MSMRVTIQTGARLHFGLLAHRPSSGRHFGGIGLMLDSPGVQLTAVSAKCDEVQAPPSVRERIERIIADYRNSASKDDAIVRCRIEVHQTIPAHQGLGSGTQLELAVGSALEILAGDREFDWDVCPDLLASRLGRGTRSALGIWGFSVGGFLVEGGKKSLHDISPLVAWHFFPYEWRMVLITPPHETGICGAEERAAFHDLPGMPEELTNRLCRIVLMDLLPAVMDGDFGDVSESLYEYGQLVGGYFAPVQGGRFASRQMEQLAKILRSRGHLGVGQSSWGPMMFVLKESQSAAEDLVRELKQDQAATGCTFHIAAPLNQCAKIKVEQS